MEKKADNVYIVQEGEGIEIWGHVLWMMRMRRYGIVLNLLGGSSMLGSNMASSVDRCLDYVGIGRNGMVLCDGFR